MSDIDHEKKAAKLERKSVALNAASRYPESHRAMERAQLHAALYAAEQQKLANTITWTTREGHKPNAETQTRIEKALGLA